MEEVKVIDSEALQSNEIELIEQNSIPQRGKKRAKKEVIMAPEGDELVSCLRNETVTVRYLIDERSGITDQKHPYYGGLVDGGHVVLTVPQLRNGTLVDPLTKDEKAFLEDYLNMDYNALSVHNKIEDNYWINYQVILGKEDTILRLSDANDYIKYKVILANKSVVARSLKALREEPKATYRYVIISDTEVYNDTVEKVNIKSRCWKEFGKNEDNFDVLRCVVETIDTRQISLDTKIEFLRKRCDELIETRPREFLAAITDSLLSSKILLRKAADAGIVAKRGDDYYYDNRPLCDKNEYPTFTVASRYLSMGKNQEIRFAIEARLQK